jgi:hypothetical protein
MFHWRGEKINLYACVFVCNKMRSLKRNVLVGDMNKQEVKRDETPGMLRRVNRSNNYRSLKGK